MAKDFESLKQQALVIKNEVEDGANSSERIGGILEDILDYNNEKLTGLSTKIDGLSNTGYKFAGIATPSTKPVSTTEKIFYLASQDGTYTNFNNLTLDSEIAAIVYTGSSWSKQSLTDSGNSAIINLGTFGADFAETVNRVPNKFRKTGTIIAYNIGATCYIKQYPGTNTSKWTDESFWQEIIRSVDFNKLVDFVQYSPMTSSPLIKAGSISSVNTDFSIHELLHSDGSATVYGSWLATDYMEIPSGKNMICFSGCGFSAGSSGCGIVFFNSEKEVVDFSLYSGGNNRSPNYETFFREIPSNAKYIRLCVYQLPNIGISKIVLFGVKKETYLDQKLEKLSEDISSIEDNLLDVEVTYLSDNEVWQKNKFTNGSGELESYGGYYAAQIDVSSYRGKNLLTKYIDGNVSRVRCGFLNSEGTLTVVNFKTNPSYTIPDDAVYVNLTINPQDAAKDFYAAILSDSSINVSELKINFDELNKKVETKFTELESGLPKETIYTALGDSITIGYGMTGTKYWEGISNRNGFLTPATSISKAGRTFVYGENSIVGNLTSIKIESNLITVLAGINDFNGNQPLGDMYKEDGETINLVSTPEECTTFYTALIYTANYLLTNIPNAVVAFILPLRKGGSRKNTQGLYLDDYWEAIEKVAQYYSIPVIPMGKEIMNAQISAISSMYFGDGLHPNALGHTVMSYYLEKKLIPIVRYNLSA